MLHPTPGLPDYCRYKGGGSALPGRAVNVASDSRARAHAPLFPPAGRTAGSSPAALPTPAFTVNGRCVYRGYGNATGPHTEVRGRKWHETRKVHLRAPPFLATICGGRVVAIRFCRAAGSASGLAPCRWHLGAVALLQASPLGGGGRRRRAETVRAPGGSRLRPVGGW